MSVPGGGRAINSRNPGNLRPGGPMRPASGAPTRNPVKPAGGQVPGRPFLPYANDDLPFGPNVPVNPRLISRVARIILPLALGYALWHWLNSRIKRPGDLNQQPEITSPTGQTFRINQRRYRDSVTMDFCSPPASGGGTEAGEDVATTEVVKTNVVGFSYSQLGPHSWSYVCGAGNGEVASAVYTFRKADGSTENVALGSFRLGPRRHNTSNRSSGSSTNGIRITSVSIGGAPYVAPPVVDPAYVPPTIPFTPQPLLPGDIPGDGDEKRPKAPPVPLPPPDGEPLGPGTKPEIGTGVGPGTGIGTGGAGQLLPLRPPVVIPLPPGQATSPEITTGTPKPPVVVVRPPVTDPGTEVTPDGVIGQPGTPPPPTLIGIAAEVGKIEQKARQLLERPAAGLDIQELIDALLDALKPGPDPYPAGSYILNPVCENKDPKVADWQAGDGAINLLNAKVDALAELLQAHKDFRQPICATKASGQPVTVQFQEIG
jgi:hypothetical protein